MPDAISSQHARPRREDEITHSPASQPTLPARPPPARRRELDAASAAARARSTAAEDAAIAAFARARGPGNDDVLYVGMNGESADFELGVLRNAGARVVAVDHGTREDTLRVGGATYRLTVADDPFAPRSGGPDTNGIAAFVATLGLSSATAKEVERVIASAPQGARAEIASIARTWSAAERGGAIPSRIVLSGHSGGEALYDADARTEWGSLRFTHVRALAKAMPRAAAQIEDVHISACSSSGQAAVPDRREAWTDAFPNLKSMWAYNGQAVGYEHHFTAWLSATAGRNDRLALREDLAAQNVVVWSRAGGFQAAGGSLEALRQKEADARTRFGAFVSGERRVASSSDPTLVADYRTYKALANRPDVSSHERRDFDDRAAKLLRVRYFEGGVRAEFAREHGAILAAGYAAIGERAPDFSRMTLAETRREAGRVEAATRKSETTDGARLRELLSKYASLDGAVILESWCRH